MEHTVVVSMIEKFTSSYSLAPPTGFRSTIQPYKTEIKQVQYSHSIPQAHLQLLNGTPCKDWASIIATYRGISSTLGTTERTWDQ